VRLARSALRLFDNARNLEKVILARRRIREHLVRRGRIKHRIVAHRRSRLADLRRRFNIGRVEFVELVDIGKYFAQLGAQALFLVRREREPRQPRYVPYLFKVDTFMSHVIILASPSAQSQVK